MKEDSNVAEVIDLTTGKKAGIRVTAKYPMIPRPTMRVSITFDEETRQVLASCEVQPGKWVRLPVTPLDSANDEDESAL